MPSRRLRAPTKPSSRGRRAVRCTTTCFIRWCYWLVVVLGPLLTCSTSTSTKFPRIELTYTGATFEQIYQVEQLVPGFIASFFDNSEVFQSTSPSVVSDAQLVSILPTDSSQVYAWTSDSTTDFVLLTLLECSLSDPTRPNPPPCQSVEVLAAIQNNGQSLSEYLSSQIQQSVVMAIQQNNPDADPSTFPAPPSLSHRFLSDAEAQARLPLPSLQQMPEPTGNYLLAKVVFRNVNTSMISLTNVLQIRVGMAQFLQFPLDSIEWASPLISPSKSVIQVEMDLFVLLSDPAVTSMQRDVLANTLIYGNYSVQVDSGSDFGMRSQLFTDLVASGGGWKDVDYVFNSIDVDKYPGTHQTAPSVSTVNLDLEGFLAHQRKVRKFVWKDASQVPTLAVPSHPTSCAFQYCTYLTWENLGSVPFWLMSIESVEKVGSVVFAGAIFEDAFANRITPGPFVPVTTKDMPSSQPTWTMYALSGNPFQLDFALNLAKMDDNSSLKVEVASHFRGDFEVSSTVTSVSHGNNKIVNYKSFMLSTNELELLLSIEDSTASPDTPPPGSTSPGCDHCQGVFEWCKSHTACNQLNSCVFTALSDAQIESTLLTTRQVGDSQDLTQVFQNCFQLTPDFDALQIFSSGIRCKMQRVCPHQISDDQTKILLWTSTPANQTIRVNHLTDSTALPVKLSIGDHKMCTLNILSTSTLLNLNTWLEECQYSNYLGQSKVTTSKRDGFDNNLQQTATFDVITFEYKYLVGPMPSLQLDVTSLDKLPSVFSTVELTTDQLPTVSLMVENKDFATLLEDLPPVSSSSANLQTDCERCKRLWIDLCMRDSLCVAYQDCIMEQSGISDGLTDFFTQNELGSTFAMTDAINLCHGDNEVGASSWRKLLNASSCYSNYSCPMQPFGIPDTAAVWHVPNRVQKLLYSGAASTTPPSPTFPLQIARDGVVNFVFVSVDASDAEFTRQLQQLVRYPDLQVMRESDTVDASSNIRKIQWSIEYAHWAGRLPYYLDPKVSQIVSGLSLNDFPAENSVLEIVAPPTPTPTPTTTTTPP